MLSNLGSFLLVLITQGLVADSRIHCSWLNREGYFEVYSIQWLIKPVGGLEEQAELPEHSGSQNPGESAATASAGSCYCC